MKVEISKSQKEALGEKLTLCVSFIKSKVQPHIIKGDTIIVNMGDMLDLCITDTKLYVYEPKTIIPGLDLYAKKVMYLEKDRKHARKYICDACPELAVEFLKNWDKAKAELVRQVKDKTNKVDELNEFVDSFEI